VHELRFRKATKIQGINHGCSKESGRHGSLGLRHRSLQDMPILFKLSGEDDITTAVCSSFAHASARYHKRRRVHNGGHEHADSKGVWSIR
jgi:hypothetical protein